MDADELISGEFWGCCEDDVMTIWQHGPFCYKWRWLDIGGGGPVMPAPPGTALFTLERPSGIGLRERYSRLPRKARNPSETEDDIAWARRELEVRRHVPDVQDGGDPDYTLKPKGWAPLTTALRPSGDRYE